MRVATLCLTSCSGCHINILDLQDKLLSILETNDLVFSPILMDVKEPQECDLAIIEGAIRNQEDEERVRKLRAKAKLLVAMGSCAVFGGIAGLGNACQNDELLKPKYATSHDTLRYPRLIPRVQPVASLVDVDYHIPGCPPPLQVVEEFLDALLTGQSPQVNDLPVCAECGRVVRGELPAEVKRTYETPVIPDECLLQQGFMCLGSVTRGGCDAPCTKAGMPCMGCRGPAHLVLSNASHGIYEDWIKRRCHYTKLPAKDLEHHLENVMHTLYAYTFAAPFMRLKRTERVAEFVYRVNWDEESLDTESSAREES
jgi:F420-non-reducing hydrogenase small subunit